MCFVPADAFLDAALRTDGSLLEHAFSRDVVLATPSTLVALLRTVAYTWRQDALADNAQQVHEVGRELYTRLATMGRHVDKLGRSLSGAVGAYNDTVGSLERRVFTQARRMHDLGVAPAGVEIAELLPLTDAVPRTVSMDEFDRRAGRLTAPAGRARIAVERGHVRRRRQAVGVRSGRSGAFNAALPQDRRVALLHPHRMRDQASPRSRADTRESILVNAPPPYGALGNSSSAGYDDGWGPATSTRAQGAATSAGSALPPRFGPDAREAVNERGLPGWAALLVLVAIAAVGGIIDTIGSIQVRGGFNIGIVVASVVAILVVKRSHMFPIVIAPPIVYSPRRAVPALPAFRRPAATSGSVRRRRELAGLRVPGHRRGHRRGADHRRHPARSPAEVAPTRVGPAGRARSSCGSANVSRSSVWLTSSTSP